MTDSNDEAHSGTAGGEPEPARGGDDVGEFRAAAPAAGGDGAPSPASGTPGAPGGDGGAPRPAARTMIRGGIVAVLGAAVPFLLMTMDRSWRWSVAVGLVGCLVSVWGIFDLVGSFDDDEATVTHRARFADVRAPLLETLGAVIVLVAVLTLAVLGALPRQILLAAVLVTASFLWCLVSAYRFGAALGVFRRRDGSEKPLHERHGFWLLVLTTLLYLPMLGSYSLSDPWETHYGEVAREMLARDDWISLWWAQDGWFWSKPILNFWTQGLFFSLLGVRFRPDEMLSAAGEGRFPQPEWAARLPVFLLTIAAVYLLYRGCARAFGRRAGFLGGLVLVSTPYFYFVSHQSMTDMPYVAPLTAAMGLFLLGFSTSADETVRVFEIDLGFRTLRVSAFHLVFGLILLSALPQVLYLLSRNLTLQIDASPHGFRPHWDEFWSGSGGRNCGLPGNEACRASTVPFALPWTNQPGKAFQPFVAGVFWAGAAGIALWMNRAERRTGRLYFIAAWFFVAVAVMGKGAPGLVLPLFIVGAYVGATRRWRDLTRLELLTGLLVILCVALPWYVQMFVRHGQPFTDRLLFHDMYKRAFVHVHDTNVGDDVSIRYYIWQLGYGLFPWTGLVAGGLLWRLRRSDTTRGFAGDASSLLLLWFVSAFAMFTITLTKFHHYILPVVPPSCMLTGVLLHRALGPRPFAERGHVPAYAGAVGIGMLLVVYGVFRMLPGSLLGDLVDGKPAPPSPMAGAISIALGVVVTVIGCFLFGGRPQPAPPPTPEGRARAYENLVIGGIGIAAAAVVGLVGRDLWTTSKGDIDGQARLMHLFTYNYRRPWPEEALDFNGMLFAFTVVAGVLCFALLLRSWRQHVVTAACAVGVLWGAWGVNVYLVKCSPHWGQRETMLAYYQHRSSPTEWLVAYQMNWKGENFYAGNRVPAFVSSGQKFKQWITEQKQEGHRVMYFTTEHGRIGSLKNELDNPKNFEVLTDKVVNNKFFVARVELDDASPTTPATEAPKEYPPEEP